MTATTIAQCIVSLTKWPAQVVKMGLDARKQIFVSQRKVDAHHKNKIRGPHKIVGAKFILFRQS